MKNDYECPKCHNIFPSQNRFIHDARCTEENPMALDQSRQIQLGIKQNPIQKENNVNNDIKVENKKPPEKKPIIKEPPKLEKLEKPIKKSSTSKEFPEIFVCELCGETLPESEKKDHMYCHNLEKEQKEQNELLNNINNFGVSQREIEQQKEIEKIIKENNERRRQIQNQQEQRPRQQNQGNNNHHNSRHNQQNQRQNIQYQQNQGHTNQHNSRHNQQNQRQNIHYQQNQGHTNQHNNRQNQRNQRQQRININMNNNLIDNDDNILTNSDIQFFNQMGIHGISNVNSRPNISNQNQPHIRITRARTGPNGVTIIQQFGNNQSNIERMMDNNNIMFPNVMTGNRISSNRRFIPISHINDINSIFEQFFSGASYHEHPTSQQILDSLPETQIDDATKLDSEKKNCVICLEDFKNEDRATILPCIHLFHTDCIKNWLKTQDSCPICKYKLTGQNLNANQ